MEKNHPNRTKHIDFFNGTKCKICFGNHRFSFQKNGGNDLFSVWRRSFSLLSLFHIYLPLDQPFHRRWKKPGITSLFPHIYLHNHSDPFFLFFTLLLSPCVTSSVSLCEEAASLSQPTRHYHCPLQYQHFPVATLLICLVGKSRPFKFSSKLFL